MNEDIDTDFSRTARAHAISAVKKKYGEKSIAGIMTKGKLLEKNALIYALKLYGLEKKGDIKGYYDIGYQLKDKFEELSQAEEWKSLSDGEAKMMEEFADNFDAMEIYHNAMLLEGHVISYGQHAAGVIAIQNDEIENYIPLMLTKNDDGEDTFVVQADMVQCEANLGFIKFDFLGLKNLNVIKRAKELVLKYHNIDIDPYKLPFESEVFEHIMAAADTDFVFQLESAGMKGMLKQLHPTCFDDIVLAVSVYRPGPMDFIPDIVKAKNEEVESEFVKKFPILKECLAESYGYPVYQEQVMKIMTICAGFSAGKADEVRRYMSKKKEEKLAHVRPEFVDGCKEKNGIAEEDSNWLFDQLMPFAKYGFNKSHAAAYSVVSYITAWFKYHYKKEYLCAAMTEQGDKTAQLVMNCREANIKVYLPSVNRSDKMFDLYDGDGIIVGLENIKGLNQAAEVIVDERNANGPYQSIIDFATRCIGKIDSRNIAQCILSGACDEFTQNRKATLSFITKYTDVYKVIVEKEEKAKLLRAQEFDTEAAEKKRATSLAKVEKDLLGLKDQISQIVDSSKEEFAIEERLALESEYLGMWVSGNPLEAYDLSNSYYSLISDARDNISDNGEEQPSFLIPGVISNFKKIVTKKGSDMCFFDLTDRFGDIIPCIVFAKAYDENKDLLKDGAVVALRAKPSYDIKDEEQIDLIVDGARYLSKHQKQIVIESSDLCQYVDQIEEILIRHKSADGYKTYVHNLQMKELRQLQFRVGEKAIEELRNNGVAAIIN